MARTIKKRIFAGAICQQIVYKVSDHAKDPKKDKPQVRFKTPEERAEHRRLIGRRKHARQFNANYSPRSLYSTLTFDNEHEVHTFEDARRIRDNYYRTLMYAFPEARIHIYMGRGKGTQRIHFHMVSDGIPEETIRKKWKNGDVLRIEHLRESCTYQGKNIGQDYTGLANYLYDHWTEEQGGQRYKYSRKTCVQPEEEPATECVREYSPERPPIAPKGYDFVSTEYNKYGYICFHYVRRREKRKLKS